MSKKLVMRIVIGLLFTCAVTFMGASVAHAGVEPSPFIAPLGDLYWVLFDSQPGFDTSWTPDSQGDLVFTTHYGTSGAGLYFGASGAFDTMSITQTSNGITAFLYDGFATGPMYTAEFMFSSLGQVLTPGSFMLDLQPQPLSPAVLHGWMTFDLSMVGGASPQPGSEVSMTLRLRDAQGSPVALVPAPIPEPATILLFAIGLIGLAAGRKTCRRT